MSRRVTRFTRFLAGLLAVAQLAAPAIVSVADGMLVSTARPAPTHDVVSTSDAVVSHGAECQFCYFLNTTVAQVAVAPPAPLHAVVQVPVSTAAALSNFARLCICHSRAPPALLA